MLPARQQASGADMAASPSGRRRNNLEGRSTVAERRVDTAVYGATAGGTMAAIAAALTIEEGNGVHRVRIDVFQQRLRDQGQVLSSW
jgi:cysteine synthase